MSPAGHERGGHGCLLYREDAELGKAVSRFVRRALGDGTRLLWLWDRHSPDEIESVLRRQEIETGRHLATRALELRGVDRTLVRSGRFRPADAAAFVREEISRASAEGYDGLRIVFEGGALAARLDDAAPLIRFEKELDGLTGALPLEVLCLYRLGEVAPQVVLDAIDAHPLVGLDGRSLPVGGRGASEAPAAPTPASPDDPEAALQQRLRQLAGSEEPAADRGEAVAARGEAPVARGEAPVAGGEATANGGQASPKGGARSTTGGEPSPASGEPGGPGEQGLLDLLAAIDEVGEGRTEEEILRVALERLCGHTGWPVGHVWMPNPAGEHLQSSGIWHLEEPDRFRRLVEAARAVRFRRGAGLPGRAWTSAHPVRIADLEGNRDFFQRSGQEVLGIRSAFAVPVFDRDRVLAVIELSSPDAKEPGRGLLRAVGYAASRLGEILAVKRMERRLESSEQRLRALEEATRDALVVTDEEGTIVSWSSAATELFGCGAQEAAGGSISRFVPEWHREVEEALLEGYLERGEARIRGRTAELHAVRADGGAAFPIELSLTSWDSEGARFVGSFVRDLSGRHEGRVDRLLAESARWNIREAVLVTTGLTPEGEATVLYASPAFLEMTGYEGSEVIGRDIDLLTGPGTDQAVFARIRGALERGEGVTEQLIAYRKDGSEFPMKWSAAPVPDQEGGGAPFVHIQTDVRRQRQAEELLKRAEVDALTGLANRSVFLNRVKRCIERCRTRPDYRFAVLFLDLDDFKDVNDSLGHVVGDDVLVSVGRRLERSVRPGDTVARYGGDEFAILLEFVLGVEDVITVAERIRTEISHPFTAEDREVVISASVGIALSDTGYTTPLRMVEDADAAMYRAKQEGPARYRIYDEELHKEALSVLRMESELIRSVRDSAFVLHYQPVVALSTGRILGFEALVRWRHPQRGFLPAEHFISLAERTGLIVSIGEWVLREACRQVQEWQRSLQLEPPLMLSVNVSGRELADHGFVPRLEEILEETGMDPGRLQLELNEKVLTEDHAALDETLAELREIGVSTCIDDFGTGRSSLAHVHNIAPGTLKVDRMLVGRLGVERGRPDSGEGEVVRAILSLARDLGMKSVAEGVETRSQLERLLELGCEFGQGFFFAASMDAEAADELLRGKRLLEGADPEGQPAAS